MYIYGRVLSFFSLKVRKPSPSIWASHIPLFSPKLDLYLDAWGGGALSLSKNRVPAMHEGAAIAPPPSVHHSALSKMDFYELLCHLGLFKRRRSL